MDQITLYKGQTFASYEEFKNNLKKYMNQEKEIFRSQTSNKFDPANPKHVKTYPNFNTNLIYTRLIYKCKFGDDIRSRGSGKRTTSTCRLGCKAFVKLNLSRDNQSLYIKDLNLLHNNHDQTKAFFHMLPENRLDITDATLNDIKDKLNVRGNKKVIQSELHKQNVFLTLKDLTNIKSKMKTVDNLQKAVDYLINEKNAIVDILQEDNIFKALFFCTDAMLKSLNAFPEILFIDGTYKLLQLNFTLVIILVEDANGCSEIVAVGLFVSEDNDTYNWFINTFYKLSPEACKKVKCIMSDKDTKERGSLSQVFSGVSLHICRFHTIQIFKREFPKKHSNNVTLKECLEILQRMVYSTSEDRYLQLYDKLREIASANFMDYFDEKWHKIRKEWTEYGMVDGNLGNLTNNRLEFINQKFKAAIEKQNSLIDFLKRFFNWEGSHNYENDFKLSKCYTTKRLTQTIPNTEGFENQYEELLTIYAYNKIKPMFDRYQWINFVSVNYDSKVCKISSDSMILTVTPTCCDCSFFKRHYLPCHHILSTRKKFNMPLFDEKLCDERWKKTYVEKHHRTFQNNPQFTKVPVRNIQKPCTKKVATKARQKKAVLTVPEKRKIMTPIMNDIMDIVSTSCGDNFETKKNILKNICETWKTDKKIKISCENPSDSIENIENSINS